jgi:hypothetical protein
VKFPELWSSTPSGEPSGAHAPPGIRTADFVLDKDFFLIEGHPDLWWVGKSRFPSGMTSKNARSKAKTGEVRGIPGLKIETWGTRGFW